MLVEGGFLDAYDYIYVIKKSKWYLLGELKPFSHLLPAKPLTEIILEQPYIHTSEQGKVSGPFTKTQIKNKIENKEIKYFDFIFVEGQKDWIPIKSIPVFRDHFLQQGDRPTADPTKSIDSKKEFLLKGARANPRRMPVPPPTSVLEQGQENLPPLHIEDLLENDSPTSTGHTMDIGKLIEAASSEDHELTEEDHALLDALPDPKRNIPSPATAGISFAEVENDLDIDPSLEDSKISTKLLGRFNSRNYLDKKLQIERAFAPGEHKLPSSLIESLEDSDEVDINNPHLQSAEEMFAGDTFEIKNAPIWMLKDVKFGNKAHTFSEILNLKVQNQINEQTELKPKGTMAWKRLAEIYEFNTQVIRKKVVKDGVEEEKIFLKRTDLRVSYYSPAVVVVDGKKYQGFCTSISMGGCFVELGKMDIVSQKDAIVKILPGAIPITIESKAIIMRVLNQKPKGLGLRFHKLPKEAEKQIEAFIQKYMDTTSKRPA